MREKRRRKKIAFLPTGCDSTKWRGKERQALSQRIESSVQVRRKKETTQKVEGREPCVACQTNNSRGRAERGESRLPGKGGGTSSRRRQRLFFWAPARPRAGRGEVSRREKPRPAQRDEARKRSVVAGERDRGRRWALKRRRWMLRRDGCTTRQGPTSAVRADAMTVPRRGRVAAARIEDGKCGKETTKEEKEACEEKKRRNGGRETGSPYPARVGRNQQIGQERGGEYYVLRRTS